MNIQSLIYSKTHGQDSNSNDWIRKAHTILVYKGLLLIFLIRDVVDGYCYH